MSIPTICVQELKAMRDKQANFILLDVREQDEYDFCNIGGKLLPLSLLPTKLDELDKNQHYVLLCRSGGRSLRAAQIMQAAGFASVTNLTGGILAWAQEIDPQVPVY